MPKLYIISGCNGAGKTTTSFTLLPELLNCENFVNADSIAYGLSPLNPGIADFQAGKLMLKRIRHLIKLRYTFAIETTLTTLSYKEMIKDAKNNGYKVILLYIWLDDYKLAVNRVKERSLKGGHSVPVNIVKRRYYKGIFNLFDKFIYLSDNWYIFDNSDISPILVASGGVNINKYINNEKVFNRINNIYDKIRRT
ncbi:MAG: zeta toxin family protein [Ignavibacteria bacterium]|nr:zeta toxin family protein [Ignavibacteria bacterium]